MSLVELGLKLQSIFGWSKEGGGGGPAINGLPPGGEFGQVLKKLSEEDYDTHWETPAGFSEPVFISNYTGSPGLSVISNSGAPGGGGVYFESQSNTVTSPTVEVLTRGTEPSLLIHSSFADTTPFVVLANGNVGVNKAAPARALDVTGEAQVVSSSASNPALLVQQNAGGATARFDNAVSLSTPTVIDTSGNVVVGAQAGTTNARLTVAGNTAITGALSVGTGLALTPSVVQVANAGVVQVTSAMNTVLVSNPDAIASATFVLPTTGLVDGMRISFSTWAAITSTTFTGGAVYGAPTSLTPVVPIALVYSAATSSWFRVT